MKVFVQEIPANQTSRKLAIYGLVMLDGYKQGCFVSDVFDIDRLRLIDWAVDAGYDVHSHPAFTLQEN